jgi:hypothetical protein
MSKGVKGKKQVGRPRTGKRPVIAMRVHNDVYKQLYRSARAHELSMSEEAEHRIRQAFEWETAHGNVRKMLADVRAVLAGGVEADLSKLGFQRVALDQGTVWAKPGMNISRMSVSVDAAAVVRLIEPELTQLVARALGQIAKERSQS